MVSPVDSDMLASSMGSQQLKAKKQQLAALQKGNNGDEAKLRKAVEGFESIFIQKMWQQMRNTVPKEGMFKSREEKMWQGMYDQELSVKMAQSGGIGLSDMLYKQLSEKLGEASRSTTTKASTLPVRELAAKDRLNTISPIMLPQPQKMKEVEEADVDGLYTPMEESGVIMEEKATPVVSTEPAILNDSAAMENAEELARQIKANGVTADPAQQARATTQPDQSIFEITKPVQKIQQVAVERDIVPAASAEQVLGMGGPIPPSPDMATINWPLPGPISSGFGWRKDPFTGKRAWHSGVDIAGKTGDPVAAAWDGKVIYSGEKSGYGKLVVIEHSNGWRSYYGHNNKLDVKVGDTVSAGKKIAEVGNTGRSTGPHLHFEVRQGELAWNPQQIRSRLMAGLSIGRVG